MISLRGLRRKIKSVRSIQQITRAMKMVSSIKFKRARARLSAAEPFGGKIRAIGASLYREVLSNQSSPQAESIVSSPLIKKRDIGKIALLVITSERGLCGGYNSVIIRKAREFISANRDKDITLLSVGKKGRSALAGPKLPLYKEYAGMLANFSFTDAQTITVDLLSLFDKENISEAYIIHSTLKSMMQQPAVIKKLLPFSFEENTNLPSLVKEGTEGSLPVIDYLYEPDPSQLLKIILPELIKSDIYHIMLDSLAAEHAARTAAMESATTNAQEVIDTLSLQANKLRQEKITQELSELTVGI